MDASAQTEQELLRELSALRSRMADVEQALTRVRQQSQADNKNTTSVHAHHPSESFSLTDDHRDVATPRIEEQMIALEAVFEAITDGIAVYDQSAHVVRANSAFFHLFNIDPQGSFNSLSLYERGQRLLIMDGNGQLLSQDEWPAVRVLRGEVIDHDRPTDTTFRTLDKREIQTAISGAPIYDKEDRILGAVIVFHDITLRKKVERRTKEVLDTLLEMAEVLVQDTDQSLSNEHSSSFDPLLQHLLQLGQRVLHCVGAGILLLDAPTSLLHPIMAVGASMREMQAWQSTLAGISLGEAFPHQFMLSSLQSGQAIKVAARPSDATEKDQQSYLLVPMFTGTQLIGILSLDYGHDAHDLSSNEVVLTAAISRLIVLILERERLFQERATSQANELALLEAHRRMDDFLSIASHELRTPLTTINGNIQLAKRRIKALPLSPQVPPGMIEKITLIEELLNRAERQVRVQNRLVSDLLDVSRIQANRLDLNMNRSDLAVIVREVIEDQRSSSGERIVLVSNIPEDLQIPIVVDNDRIAQVITNFLTNALKYSAPHLPVEVQVQVNAQSARVSVHDQGPGLPPDEQKKLWERFYRVPGIAVQSGSGVGLGLGLHICRTIVERHNGQVGVESQVGQGSTFWFTLPLTAVACDQPV